MTLRIVVISDTHGLHRRLHVPEGDVLVHGGDVTGHGTLAELADFNAWLGDLPHPHKIIIAGNHDFCIQDHPAEARSAITNATYLEDDGVVLQGVYFYGAPWQPWFFDWAFNLKRGSEIRAKWELIPSTVDILITHGPPANILDETFLGVHTGCQDLLGIVRQVKPRYHIFGHIHEAAGSFESEETTHINASICRFPEYTPLRKAIVIDV